MSTERRSAPRALAAAGVALLALGLLAGCGKRAAPAAGAAATPGAMDSSVHVVMDSTPAPTMNKAVRGFEPVVIPGQSSSSGAAGDEAAAPSTTPSTDAATPTVTSASDASDSVAATAHRPKVKRRVPK